MYSCSARAGAEKQVLKNKAETKIRTKKKPRCISANRVNCGEEFQTCTSEIVAMQTTLCEQYRWNIQKLQPTL